MWFRLACPKLAAVSMACLAAPALAAEPSGCEVEAVNGPEAQLWSQGAWRPLVAGLSIPRDSIVLTDAVTRARIECADGLELTVGVATQINLETVAGRKPGGVAQLIKGVLGVFSPRVARQAFEVRTQTATTKISEARALVQAGQDNETAVFVRGGRAEVRSETGAGATLGAGEGISIDASGAAGQIKGWGAARIAAATDALGFDWN